MDYQRIYNNIINNAQSRGGILGYTEKHHIIPRSMGRSNDSSNLAVLTAKEHFICHLLLTKMYDESSPEWYKVIKAFMFMKSSRDNMKHRYTSNIYVYYRERFSKAQSIAQAGVKNSSYGSMWIFNPVIRQTKKLLKTDVIPDGWFKGRVINFDLYNETSMKKELRIEMGEVEFEKRRRENLSKKMKGRQTNPMIQETREKISKSHLQREILGYPGSTKGMILGPRTAETKEKIRKANLGENNYMYGKEHTIETKEKIRNSMKGRKHSPETKEKIRKAMKIRY